LDPASEQLASTGSSIPIYSQGPASSALNTSSGSTQTSVPVPRPSLSYPTGSVYKDGRYTGSSANAYYGNVQIAAVIKGGKLVDVQFLDYPRDRNYSVQASNYAMPILKSEAIKAQNAQVDTVSGATFTSNAFIASLSSALSRAKA